MTTAVKQECEDGSITRGGYGRGRSNWQRKPKGVTMTHEYQGNKQQPLKKIWAQELWREGMAVEEKVIL